PSDLPGPLVYGRTHWLNLSTGDVHITKQVEPHAWVMKSPQVWTLSMDQRRCQRQRPDEVLEMALDPHCRLSREVSETLQGITPPREVLITQRTDHRNFEVAIESLGLMFLVNSSKLLYSPQLRLEVDPDQDAGTRYGLEQKLVCRGAENPSLRTVLVPLGGTITTTKKSCHVSIRIGASNRYGKFSINDTLGRIDCAAEPQLLYTKALLHAYTSFLLPDPLTGRTGAEESLHWLQSGACSPWTVLGGEVGFLSHITKLTPVREYYPQGRRVMGVTKWNDSVTTHNQHPLYHQAVKSIVRTSQGLEAFTPLRPDKTYNVEEVLVQTDKKLTLRAWERRQLYERPTADHHPTMDSRTPDAVYKSRDRPLSSDSRYMDDVLKLMEPFVMSAPRGSADELEDYLAAKQRRKVRDKRDAFERKSRADCRRLAEFLLAQWPCLEPSAEGFPDVDVQVHVGPAIDAALPEWSRRFRNHEFHRHVQAVQRILDEHRSEGKRTIAANATPTHRQNSFLCARKLDTSQTNVTRPFEELRASLEAPTAAMSRSQIRWLQRGSLWPAITTVTLLEHLGSNCNTPPSFLPRMREGLVALTKLQRDMRLNECYLAGDVTRFQDEEANSGHSNWDPARNPDWLLLELESNVLIRPDQVDVARATISPPSDANSVLQTNMGQGKTSCIMPMAAASLADGKNLVRVIVPKALLLQTAHLLQSRLGGC
ncbi:hypothetical protein QBC34DRAFT_479587, partial [Podospora aff. communis PSN243]